MIDSIIPAQTVIDGIKLAIPNTLIELNQYLKDHWNLDTKYCILVNYIGGIALSLTLQVMVQAEPLFIFYSILQGAAIGYAAGRAYDKSRSSENNSGA